MTNETTTEKTSFVSNLKAKAQKLPLKTIAITAAATAVVVYVIANKDDIQTKTFEVTNVEELPNGDVRVETKLIED